MLKILIAPTAFKGTFSPGEIAEAIAAGAKESGGAFELSMAPLADGGDGTLEALRLAVGGQLHPVVVQGADSRCHSAAWLKVDGGCAVVELASACGIGLIPPQALSPVKAHTYGLGQLLSDCLREGERDIVVAVGGSASTDGGAGALAALGADFFDKDGNKLPLGGGALVRLARLQLNQLKSLMSGLRVRVATDVENPLLGRNGAAFVYGPQKGASEEDCLLLDRALSCFADQMEQETGKSLRDAPGSGAAGGAAFGLSLALGAEIVSGFQWMSQQLELEKRIAAADIVVTGEGRLDNQTLLGKGVGQLAQLCRKIDRPLWAISARCDTSINWKTHGFQKVAAVAADGLLAARLDVQSAACRMFTEVSN